MKPSLILISAFVFLVQISKAQTEKGNQALGANLNFTYYQQNGASIDPLSNTSSRNDSKNTIYTVGPTYSYFIADNLDLGISLNYSAQNYNNGTNYSPSEQHIKSYGGSLFLRKYVLYKNKLGFRAGPYLDYFYGNQKFIYSGQSSVYDLNSKSNTYAGGLNLDLVYYPTPHLGVSVDFADLSYAHTKTNNGTQGFANTDQVNFNFINNNLGLSLLYVFGGK